MDIQICSSLKLWSDSILAHAVVGKFCTVHMKFLKHLSKKTEMIEIGLKFANHNLTADNMVSYN